MNSFERVIYFGQLAYEAYCKQTDNKSLVSGAELPAWVDLKLEIQDAWIAAADAVLGATERV